MISDAASANASQLAAGGSFLTNARASPRVSSSDQPVPDGNSATLQSPSAGASILKASALAHPGPGLKRTGAAAETPAATSAAMIDSRVNIGGRTLAGFSRRGQCNCSPASARCEIAL